MNETGVLTLSYNFCVDEGEAATNLSGGIWDSFVFKMQERCCSNKSLIYCRVLSSDVLM